MKAYDFKELAKRLSDDGREVAEDAAVKAFEQVFDWLEDSARESKTPVDDVVMGVVKPLKVYALEYLDKIDGKEG